MISEARDERHPDAASPDGPLLVDQLRFMAARYPDEIAYRDLDAGDSITFREWDLASNRLARWLTDHGVGRGDRVAIYVSSSLPLRWVIAYSAVHKAGAVAVPTNTRLSEREVVAILVHSGASAMITDASAPVSVGALRSALPDLGPVLDASEPIRADEPAGDVHHWSEIAEYDDVAFQVGVGEDDLADIMYTSGTTGLPKGVVVRHRDVAMIPNSAPSWSGAEWLHGAPLFTFAGIAFVYSPMKLGLSGSYLPTFDPGRWLDVVERNRPSMVFLVPAMAELIVVHPRFSAADLSAPAMVSIGSSPLAPATRDLLRSRMPQAVVANSYGLTEAGPAYIVMSEDDASRRGSIGRPAPPLEARIVAPESGEVVGAGVVGELQTRLPGLRREYYRNPAATSATWTSDGWLCTGDLAHGDEQGYIYVVGRLKDVIIRGGNNVYATDVESVLVEHPDVQECAVVGVPHDVLGEDVAAWIVVVPGRSLAGPDILDFCTGRLADYKQPRVIHFVESLPRNATGKVMKHRLGHQAGPEAGPAS